MPQMYRALFSLYVCAVAFTFVKSMQIRAAVDPKIANDPNKKFLSWAQLFAEASVMAYSILGGIYTVAAMLFFDKYNFSIPVVMRLVYLLLAGLTGKVAYQIHDSDMPQVDWSNVSYINMAISAGLNAGNMVLIILFFFSVFV